MASNLYERSSNKSIQNIYLKRVIPTIEQITELYLKLVSASYCSHNSSSSTKNGKIPYQRLVLRFDGSIT